MTAIKPPGGPRGIQGPTETDPSDEVSGTAGSGSNDPMAAASPGANAADAFQGVVAEFRAGRLSPDETVARLTEAAIERNGVPAALRGVVEAEMRQLLSRDPGIRALLREMGATVPTEK